MVLQDVLLSLVSAMTKRVLWSFLLLRLFYWEVLRTGSFRKSLQREPRFSSDLGSEAFLLSSFVCFDWIVEEPFIFIEVVASLRFLHSGSSSESKLRSVRVLEWLVFTIVNRSRRMDTGVGCLCHVFSDEHFVLVGLPCLGETVLRLRFLLAERQISKRSVGGFRVERLEDGGVARESCPYL